MDLVFSEVTVSFGAWETQPEEDEEPVPNTYELEDERSSRSFDLLNRIIVDPPFALLIKAVEVHAFKADSVRGAFEIRCLTTAIGFLHRLSSFVWYGTAPSPTAAVVESLAQSCRLLRDLSVPLNSLHALPLEHIESLCSISITTLRRMWPQQGLTMEHSFVAARCETVHQNLHTLQLPFHSAADVPLRYLPRLTDLGLLIMKTPDELASVLRQLPQLRSLSFYSLASQEAELFAALSTLKSDLPNLTSFAIHTGDVGILEMPYTEMFDSFLRDRRELRRLYCSLEVPPESLGLYLDTIRTLKNLELFFLLLTSQPYTAEFFENLLSHLPARLVGMGLTSSGLLSDASVFDQLWTHFTDFQYLYIRTWEATDVEAEAITKGTKSLQLLGYNGRFYDVEYPHGKPALLPPWSARKVAFRNARDFGCEGWERFMSYLAIEP